MDEKVEFVPVYKTFERAKIAFIKSLLQANGIKYYVDNEHAASLGAGEVSNVMNVMVEKKDSLVASELLKDIK